MDSVITIYIEGKTNSTDVRDNEMKHFKENVRE